MYLEWQGHTFNIHRLYMNGCLFVCFYEVFIAGSWRPSFRISLSMFVYSMYDHQVALMLCSGLWTVMYQKFRTWLHWCDTVSDFFIDNVHVWSIFGSVTQLCVMLMFKMCNKIIKKSYACWLKFVLTIVTW